MSTYVSAEAFLADARLRLEALGESRGILVVEGPDDKRLFYSRVIDPSQIMPSGGRRLLLAAFEARSAEDAESMLFFTDCDYAVRAGTMRGGPGLVITQGTDVESDLLSLGTLAPVVTEIVPSALAGNKVDRVCAEILHAATTLTLPVGRARMATQPLGVELGFDSLEFSKYWDAKTKSFDFAKLCLVIGAKLKANQVENHDVRHLIEATPSDEGMCKGKDMVRAIRWILHDRYGVGNGVSPEILGRMLRIAMGPELFERWPAVQRVRSWQRRTGRLILH